MKRKISFLLAFIMVLTIIPFGSFAQNYDKQLEEAIVKSKKLFNIGSEYDKFDQSVSSRDGVVVFYLKWSDSKEKLENIDVSITVDGTILSYGKWKPIYSEQRPKLPKVSKEEGLELAKDFIKKVAPKFADNIKQMDVSEPLNLNSDGYNYYFVRTENGVPYYNNSLYVDVDNSTGEVRNYYANWDMDLTFSDTKGIVSLEKAEKLYKEKIGLDLIYKTSYGDRNPKIFLAYNPLNANLGINAKDGEVTLLNDYYPIYEKASDMGGSGDAPADELSPDEKDAVEDIAGLISQKEAEKIGRDILELDPEYKLNYVNLYKNWRSDDSYNWQLEFIKGSDSEAYYANTNIDAKTKELVSFYKFGPEESGKKIQYNEEQALEIAKEYIKKTASDKYELVELRNSHEGFRPLEEQRRYSFGFIRKLDSAYVEQDGITITVDAINGKVTEYRITWSNREFPSQDNVMSIDKAYDILFDNIGIELKYVNLNRYEGITKNNKETILVYGLKTDKPSIIDANNGTILNHMGEPYKVPTIVSYKDIDNSYAKEKINILAQFGIAFPGEEFKPKEKIIQKDFLYLLAKANNPYFEVNKSENKLYTYLINAGIIKEDEKAPEKIVTKEEGVKYIIRALKYDKVADLTEIYKELFKDTEDITPELKGYVSIAYGLKIVEGYNGYLNPKAELNREDGANLIYNYLFTGM